MTRTQLLLVMWGALMIDATTVIIMVSTLIHFWPFTGGA